MVEFTTVKAKGDRIVRGKDGEMRVKIAPGEVCFVVCSLCSGADFSQRVVVLGEYRLAVRKGRATVLGATLSPDSTRPYVDVYAPSSHSLPVIRYLESEDNEVVISLSQLKSGLRPLKKLSPLFSRLWNEIATVLDGEEASETRSSFQIVRCMHIPLRELNTNHHSFSQLRVAQRRYPCTKSTHHQSGTRHLQECLLVNGTARAYQPQ